MDEVGDNAGSGGNMEAVLHCQSCLSDKRTQRYMEYQWWIHYYQNSVRITRTQLLESAKSEAGSVFFFFFSYQVLRWIPSDPEGSQKRSHHARMMISVSVTDNDPTPDPKGDLGQHQWTNIRHGGNPSNLNKLSSCYRIVMLLLLGLAENFRRQNWIPGLLEILITIASALQCLHIYNRRKFYPPFVEGQENYSRYETPPLKVKQVYVFVPPWNSVQTSKTARTIIKAPIPGRVNTLRDCHIQSSNTE